MLAFRSQPMYSTAMRKRTGQTCRGLASRAASCSNQLPASYTTSVSRSAGDVDLVLLMTTSLWCESSPVKGIPAMKVGRPIFVCMGTIRPFGAAVALQLRRNSHGYKVVATFAHGACGLRRREADQQLMEDNKLCSSREYWSFVCF
jgi:hypothetical protein